jgi:hypothetical protein
MVPRSPTTQGGPSSPSRVPPRTPSPRWQGNPYQRPPTDAEVSKDRRRNRSLIRFIACFGLLLLYGFGVAPMALLTALTQVPPTFTALAARVGWWLQVAYPFVQVGLLVLLGYVLLHLVIGAGMLMQQAARRRAVVLQTMLVDLPRTPITELGRGVDLFAAIGLGLAQVLQHLQAIIPALPSGLPALPPGLLLPMLLVLCALAGLLVVLTYSPRRRAVRSRDRLATLRAHAHHPIWPGYRWTLFPAPAKARSILGPYELAALWHPPSLELETQFAWRSSKHLPAPVSAFLTSDEAVAAELRTVQPRPASPGELGRSRLGIAYAYRRDGSRALIGPTLRDLRQGWDTMGSMGSGKSSLIETMVVEIARLGGGCGIIDAKGDLCDRLLRILPPEAYRRVIVIDTTAPIIPCINPFDRRIIRDKPRDVIAGEIGQIFARIEPEIWAGAMGMQQALFMGVSAILEGERDPTLLHLERFYLSPKYREQVLSRVYDKAIRDYWLVQVPAMPEKIKTSIDSLKRRLTGLVGSETGQRLLCQPHSTIDLTVAMREQTILIIKFVPEKIGETNAAFWGAALFQSIVSATFNQQEQTDPEQRWDA